MNTLELENVLLVLDEEILNRFFQYPKYIGSDILSDGFPVNVFFLMEKNPNSVWNFIFVTAVRIEEDPHTSHHCWFVVGQN